MKTKILSLIFGVGLSGCSLDSPTEGKTHVIALMGQSNMVGTEVSINDPNDPRLKVLTLDNQMQNAKEPLHSSVSGESSYKELNNSPGTGPGLSFAVNLLSYLNEKDSIVLVPCARGASSMNEQINPASSNFFGAFYERSLLSVCKERIQIALDKNKNSVYSGVLYYQGETDATLAYGNSNPDFSYWSEGIKRIRSELNESFNSDRMIMVEINKVLPCDYSCQFAWNAFKYNQYILSIETGVGIVSGNDLELVDPIHLNASSQVILGERLALEYKNLYLTD